MAPGSRPRQIAVLVAAFSLIALFGSELVQHAHAEAPPKEQSGCDVSIDHITTRFIPAGRFKRICEHFTGVENKDGKIIERSQPDERAGFYMIVTLDLFSAPFPGNGAFIVEYIHSENRRPQTKLFPLLDANPSAREAFLGLTGEDWPSQDRSMVAWKVSLIGPDGKTVIDSQSYLWDIPKKENQDGDETPVSEEG